MDAKTGIAQGRCIIKIKMASIQIWGIPYLGYPKGCDHVIYR